MTKTWSRIAIYPQCKRRGIEIGNECGLLGLVIDAESKNSIRLFLCGFADCRRRKIKCNGTQPCGFCIRAKTSCTFFSDYARGRIPAVVPSTRADEDTVSTSRSSVPGQQLTPLLPRTHPESQGQPLSHTPSVYTGDSTPNSPEPCQTDFQGHYIGPASGLSFLLRIQKRLHHAISFSQTSSIFTFGDAPLHLPESDPSFCMMLPRPDAQRLMDRYFDFAMST